jgi:hypothetical protein
MRRPGDTTRPPEGGRVAARRRLYTEQRSLEPSESEAKKQAPARRKATKPKKKR